jgi:hypothetical protein
MIEVLRETTGTVDGFTYQPHVYYVNKKSGKLVGFQPVGGQVVIYEKAKAFSKSYRTFEKMSEVEAV